MARPLAAVMVFLLQFELACAQSVPNVPAKKVDEKVEKAWRSAPKAPDIPGSRRLEPGRRVDLLADAPSGKSETRWPSNSIVISSGVPGTLSIKDRRELGLTVMNLSLIIKELRASGEIDSETSNAEMAAAVAVNLAGKHPELAGRVDWDVIISFIERLMPLVIGVKFTTE